MNKTAEQSINGHRFFTTRFPVLDGLVMWARIGKVFAPSIAELRRVDPASLARVFAALDGGVKEFDLAKAGEIFATFGPSIVALFQGVEPLVLRQLTREMFSMTTAVKDGQPFKFSEGEHVFDLVFEDNLWFLVVALFWVGRHNFTTFFPGGRVAAMPTTTPTKG